MRRFQRVAVTWAMALAGATTTMLAVQAPVPPPPPPPVPARDAVPMMPRGPAGPTVRTIPVGTAIISGIVTAADTGRPLKGVRVSVNGTVPAPPRAGGPGAGTTMTLAPMSMPQGAAGFSNAQNVQGVSRSALTDAQGRFSFERLPAGRFNVNANRTGYLNATYGQKRPQGRGTPVMVAEGQQVQIAMPMTKGGAITGVVVGPDGEPQANAQVRAWRFSTTTGVKLLQPMGGVSTDDRGVYRLHSLQPGDYVVSATPNNFDLSSERMAQETSVLEAAIRSGAMKPSPGPGFPATVTVTMPPPEPAGDMGPVSYLPTYHPSTGVAAEAVVIRITGGDEHSSADIQAQLIRSSVIQGTLAAALPEGVAVQIALLPDDPSTPGGSPQARVQNDGRFVLGNVSPGKYTLMAWTVPGPRPQITNGGNAVAPSGQVSFSTGPPRLEDSQKLWGREPVTVDGTAPVSVTLSLQPGRTVAGRVLFEMARPPDLTQARLMASLGHANTGVSMPVPPPAQVPVAPDGTFVFKGVMPGKYSLRVGGNVKSSIVDGRDTLDVPLEFNGDRDITDAMVTLTDQVSELSGTLTDAAGKPAFDYSILAVSADRRFWTPGSRRIQVAQLGLDGRYTLRNLPPGDYLVAAISDFEPGSQYDPNLLSSLAGASMRVTIAEGGRITQDIRVAK